MRGGSGLRKAGLETILFTVSIDSIALMPCNPNIGGSSKGHLVRELDAWEGRWERLLTRPLFSQKCSMNLRVLRSILSELRRINRLTAGV